MRAGGVGSSQKVHVNFRCRQEPRPRPRNCGSRRALEGLCNITLESVRGGGGPSQPSPHNTEGIGADDRTTACFAPPLDDPDPATPLALTPTLGGALALALQRDYTAVHYAASRHEVECLKLLIKAGADVNNEDAVRDPRGEGCEGMHGARPVARGHGSNRAVAARPGARNYGADRRAAGLRCWVRKHLVGERFPAGVPKQTRGGSAPPRTTPRVPCTPPAPAPTPTIAPLHAQRLRACPSSAACLASPPDCGPAGWPYRARKPPAV